MRSYRKLHPGMFIQFFSCFQVMYPSHLRKYLPLTDTCFRFHLMMQWFLSGSHATEWHQPLKQSWPPAKWKLFLFCSSEGGSQVAFSCFIRRSLCPFFGKVGDISKDVETFVYKFIKQIWYSVLTADNYCMFSPQYA